MHSLTMIPRNIFLFLALTAGWWCPLRAAPDSPPAKVGGERPELFARSNLTAWCIVPFDGAKRGPEARAAMLEKLGIGKLAYDYRAEHIPTFDAEMEALRKHHLELTAWWFPGSLNEEAKGILDVIRRHGVHPQLWISHGVADPPDEAARLTLIESEAASLEPIAREAAALGCKVGLYNHGGWFGEPENQLAILEKMRKHGQTNVGLVYNLHHGHGHLDRFPALLEKMKPHLMALNLNGMSRGAKPDASGEKILPLGQGDLDLELLRTIRNCGWHGPIGILNHTDEDAEIRLRDNLDGLQWLVKELNAPGSGGPKPIPKSWKRAPSAE